MAHDAVSGAPQAVGFDFVEQLRRQLKAEIGDLDAQGRKRGLKALLTARGDQMSTTCRSSAKPTRQVVPSPGSMLAVR